MGNVGSGKTLSVVRDIALNKDGRITYSNIQTKGIKNNIVINRDMIIKKVEVGVKKNGEIIYKKILNREFWEDAIKKHKGINIVLDEIQTLLNSRRAMSKDNIIMTDFLSLIRRIMGSANAAGDLIMISQLERRIDVIAKEMCNHTRFHICHFMKSCNSCLYTWQENNEMPEQLRICPKCGGFKVSIHSHRIEVWHFATVDDFVRWKYYGRKTYYRHYFIIDVVDFFPRYDTLQWDNLLSEV